VARTQDKTFHVRRVASKEDRKRPSVFMRLKVDEAFKGVALFEPDPELEENPGYFEYYDHFDKQGNSYVPCAGEKCPFCAANDNPSTRALTAWYFPDAADVKDKLKVFTMNYSTTQEISDEAEDEGGLLGKVVRIKRLEPAEKGNYRVKITADKPLTKTAVKEAMRELEEKFPAGLEDLVERQLKVQMERLKALEAMEDDEEDEEEERPTARRGKPVAEEAEEAEEEDEDEQDELVALEEVEVEILRVSRKNNSITVEQEGEEIELVAEEEEIDLSDYRKGDSVTVSAEYDDSEEGWILTAISGEEEAEEEEEEDAEAEEEQISGGVYEVLKVQEQDEIFDLQNEDGKLKMWLGDGLEVDYDEVKKGTQVTVDAVKDEEGDWIITAIEVEQPAKHAPRKRTAAKPKPKPRSRRTAK